MTYSEVIAREHLSAVDSSPPLSKASSRPTNEPTLATTILEAGAKLGQQIRVRAAEISAALQDTAANTRRNTEPPLAPPSFTEWQELLDACTDYATKRGWRFDMTDFMDLDSAAKDHEAQAARIKAMPVALQYADRLATPSAYPELLAQFRRCQQLVAVEAVYNTLVTTCRALELLPPKPSTSPEALVTSSRAATCTPNGDAPAVTSAESVLLGMDLSRPVQEIALVLQKSEQLLCQSGAESLRLRRLYRASFIVEFGLAHGLPAWDDAQSKRILREFLERLKECGHDGETGALIKGLVLDGLAPAPSSLRDAALDWFENNKVKALAGGALLAGVAGVLAAGAAIAASGCRSARLSR
eukprot:CAMPEP_0119301644 /NCGR_PEP_ID=MMETSP1333-20130426/3380_1 /TAXON_ID=418940 /ORGANISM="Scyphosphaera apsteinii, Strain RCC1455" /LENGTH=356 /DNA_ID=CAMNT_0007303767 /DNA_START=58 /DNA_END=1128 /DNA_ORIENTATION=-